MVRPRYKSVIIITFTTTNHDSMTGFGFVTFVPSSSLDVALSCTKFEQITAVQMSKN